MLTHRQEIPRLSHPGTRARGGDPASQRGLALGDEDLLSSRTVSLWYTAWAPFHGAGGPHW